MAHHHGVAHHALAIMVLASVEAVHADLAPVDDEEALAPLAMPGLLAGLHQQVFSHNKALFVVRCGAGIGLGQVRMVEQGRNGLVGGGGRVGLRKMGVLRETGFEGGQGSSAGQRRGTCACGRARAGG